MWRCWTAPERRSRTNSRASSRWGSGCWAMRSGGSSKSKSAMELKPEPSGSEQLLLAGGPLGQRAAEMFVGAARGGTAAGRAVEEADLQQVGLVDVLDRVGLLADR